MKITYKAKTLIDGYKLGLQYAGKTFIAVPLERAIKGSIIAYKNKIMRIKTDPLMMRAEQDKFGRDKTYTLAYFEWQPITNISLLWS